APMCPPEVPVAPMCPPNAFVIGPNGLQRVMPMPEPPGFLIAPTPVPTGSFVIDEKGLAHPVPTLVKFQGANSFVVGVCGIGQALPACGSACAAQPTSGRGACPSCAQSAAANPLSGTWYRDAGVAVIALTFAGDEMTARMSMRE